MAHTKHTRHIHFEYLPKRGYNPEKLNEAKAALPILQTAELTLAQAKGKGPGQIQKGAGGSLTDQLPLDASGVKGGESRGDTCPALSQAVHLLFGSATSLNSWNLGTVPLGLAAALKTDPSCTSD